MSYQIAIDGPAGAGKSTIAKLVSKEMNFVYVDTGAMYRALALYCLNEGVDKDDEAKVVSLCMNADVSIKYIGGEQAVFLNGENVNGLIRTEEVGNMASATSVNADVRKKLVELQQKLAAKENVVMDGRDIGTVVLPNAEVKVYLTASSAERARRRYLELQAKGETESLEKIEADIIERDHRDMTREISPLKQAEDAILVDSSDMTIDEVVDTLMTLVKKASENR